MFIQEPHGSTALLVRDLGYLEALAATIRGGICEFALAVG